MAYRTVKHHPTIDPASGARGGHFYIYDDVLSQPKFANLLADIETRLTDLELQGRISRLGPLKSAKDMVRQAQQSGARTIVAVGSDRTVAEVVNAIAGTELTLGIIPTSTPSHIGKLLGIPNGDVACDILAARKLELLDLGKINDLYFLTSARVEAESPITLECDNHYTVQSMNTSSSITISNLERNAGCQDGYLEATIESVTGGWFRKEVKRSHIPFRQGRLSAGDTNKALVEKTYTVKLPTSIEVIPRVLKVIVGRDRAF